MICYRKYGVQRPVHPGCVITGLRKIRPWDSVPLPPSLRRISLAGKFTESKGAAAISIVTM